MELAMRKKRKQLPLPLPIPDDVTVIFRRYRKHPKSGKILDAHLYGIKAWPIYIKKK